MRAATVQNAVSGCTATGIQPLNPDIFPEHLYSASVTTDQPLPNPADAPITGGVLVNSTVISPKQTVVATMEYQDVLDEVSPLPHAKFSNTRKKRRSKGSAHQLHIWNNLKKSSLIKRKKQGKN